MSVVTLSLPEEAKYILSKLKGTGHESYVVGGCVRDSILGRTPHDWDICTSALPQQVIKVFSGQHIIETGLKHGTVTLMLDGSPFEITTFRQDGSYSDCRRPDSVRFLTSPKEDMARRDFTINAMAYNPESGLLDYFGGEQDAEAGVIKCVGNPDKRFSEDALRILRALRFASTYGFSIDPDTAESIHKNVAKLDSIAKERINTELCKLLCGKGVLKVLLDYSDVFGIIIPELKPCIGFDQNNKFHQYPIYDHIAHAVANCPTNDIITKVALLLHDIGKPLCYTEDANGGHFYGHAVFSHELSVQALERLRFDTKSKKDIQALVVNHDAVLEPTPKVARRWLNKLGTLQVERLLDVKCADTMAHTEGTQEERLKKYAQLRALVSEAVESESCFTMKDLAINGRDVMQLGVPQGKLIGSVLKTLLSKIIDGNIPNERGALLDEAKTIILNHM